MSAHRQVESTVHTLSLLRGYQGLILDSGGLASTIVALIEKSATSPAVVSLELEKSGGQRYLRNGPAPRGLLALAVTPLLVEVAVQTTELRMKASLLLPLVSLGHPVLFGFFAALTMTGALLLYRLDVRARETMAAQRSGRELALQVAHDIRSPLAALSVLAERSTALNENDRALLVISTERIRGVAEDLLNRGGRRSRETDLLPLIQSVITEKERVHHFRPGLGISLESPQRVFASCKPAELQRAVSNLIENAIEANPSDPRVGVSISRDGERVKVEVSDRGPGFSKESLERLGEFGNTHGKANGHGHGLAQVARFAREAMGQLEVLPPLPASSSPNRVTIWLPVAAEPLRL